MMTRHGQTMAAETRKLSYGITEKGWIMERKKNAGS
jgi:hypothetical protein